MFLERNLYPNSMLINVKILIPPSTGIQGGGQHPGGGGGPGWAKMFFSTKKNKIIIIIFLTFIFKFVIYLFNSKLNPKN